jgi:predicted protein tyrosine phosphatase
MSPPINKGCDVVNIVVTGFTRARRIKRRGFTGVITIEDPDVKPSHRLRFHEPDAPAHLVLRFEDLDSPSDRIRTATREHVADALAFARTVNGALLVHCWAGVSRSTSITLAIIADRLGPGHEPEALAELLKLAPEAVPNLLVTQHADALLERHGALLAVVHARDAMREQSRIRRRLNEAAVLNAYGADAAYG